MPTTTPDPAIIRAPFRPRVGDKVVIRPEFRRGPQDAGQWTVVKVDRVNVVLAPPVPGRNLRCNPTYLAPFDPSDPQDRQGPSVDPNLTRPTLHPGTLVRWSGPKAQDGLFVVLADKFDRINIVRLGGDGGRYWRVPAQSLTRVNPAEVLA